MIVNYYISLIHYFRFIPASLVCFHEAGFMEEDDDITMQTNLIAAGKHQKNATTKTPRESSRTVIMAAAVKRKRPSTNGVSNESFQRGIQSSKVLRLIQTARRLWRDSARTSRLRHRRDILRRFPSGVRVQPCKERDCKTQNV